MANGAGLTKQSRHGTEGQALKPVTPVSTIMMNGTRIIAMDAHLHTVTGNRRAKYERTCERHEDAGEVLGLSVV